MQKLSVWWSLFWCLWLVLLALRPKQVEEFERIIDKTCDSSCQLFTLLVALLTVFLQSKASFRSFVPRVSRGKVRTSDLSPKVTGSEWTPVTHKSSEAQVLSSASDYLQKNPKISNPKYIVYTLHLEIIWVSPKYLEIYYTILRHRGLVGGALELWGLAPQASARVAKAWCEQQLGCLTWIRGKSDTSVM